MRVWRELLLGRLHILPSHQHKQKQPGTWLLCSNIKANNSNNNINNNSNQNWSSSNGSNRTTKTKTKTTKSAAKAVAVATTARAAAVQQHATGHVRTGRADTDGHTNEDGQRLRSPLVLLRQINDVVHHSGRRGGVHGQTSKGTPRFHGTSPCGTSL